MINKTFKTESPQQLYAKITKLEADKELLRVYLHELIEAFYKTLNGSYEPKFKLNPSFLELFKNLKRCAKCAPNHSFFGPIFCNQEDIGEPNYSGPKGGEHE